MHCLCVAWYQFATGPNTLTVEQVRPPEPRGASHATYAAERSAILASLERRAVRIAETLNALPGISCNPAEGAMYLFPQLALPPRAVAAAAAAGTAADEFYCLRLLEATGLVVVPGSGFRQVTPPLPPCDRSPLPSYHPSLVITPPVPGLPAGGGDAPLPHDLPAGRGGPRWRAQQARRLPAKLHARV